MSIDVGTAFTRCRDGEEHMWNPTTNGGECQAAPGEDYGRGSEVRTGEGETRCWDEVWTVILCTIIIRSGTKTLPRLI